MSCVSHHQCRSWATGQYCCQDNRCCDNIQEYETDYQYDYQYYTTETYYHYHTDYSEDSNQTSAEFIGNETFSVYENYDDDVENTTVEIVAIDQSEDDNEESVKVTTFYETLSKNSTEEKPNHDKKLSEETEIVAMSEVEKVNIIHYSGSGEVTEESSEELLEADLSGEVQINNLSLELDENELSTIWSVSAIETSSQSDVYPEDFGEDNLQDGSGSGSDFIEFHLEISGAVGELEQENDDILEDIFSDSTDEFDDSSGSIIIDNILTGAVNAPEDNIKHELNVKVVNLTKHLEKSTKEVAWKSDATVRESCFSVLILHMTLLLTL